MKKLCTVLMAVLLAALVLTTAMAADEPMRMTWWGSESSNKIYLGVSDMFSQELGIEVENEYLSWDDYWTKLNTLAAANDLPDSLRMDLAYIKSYVDKGLLMDLTELVEKGLIDLSDVPESAISGGMFNGGLYAINAGSNSIGMLYNV
ncbi:MAG: extracellular solute-binding protein, partial [Clostridia bacterium]|nr:extracellular solute-binding protein [Clostridia bacterium]